MAFEHDRHLNPCNAHFSIGIPLEGPVPSNVNVACIKGEERYTLKQEKGDVKKKK